MKTFSKIRYAAYLTFTFVIASMMFVEAQSFTYKPIKGFTDDVNGQLEAFFESTVPMKTRKVAVFDCDGTLFGQAPHYLADEALLEYAKKNYEGKTDKMSKEKMAVVDKLLHGNNVGVEYVQNRIKFLSGLTPEQIATIGNDCFHEKFQHKMYPEMKQLLANLKDFDFEIWILSASPEFLYEKFCAEQLGIPQERILGVKSLVNSEGITTDQLIFPVPQDEGKAEAVYSFIKARPLFVGGNSRGDMEMMNTSVGLKMIVNPDAKKVENGAEAGDMKGYTVKDYWDKEGAITVYCNDVPVGDVKYVCDEWGVKLNASNPKVDKKVINY